MQSSKQYFIGLAAALLALGSCSEELLESSIGDQSLLPIQLSGQILHENVTRANDYGFVSGDRMGIYIVDYENGQPGTLSATDNRASNLIYTYDGDSYRWTAPTTVYWRDMETPVDIYAYYPSVNYIETPSAWNFEVQADQSTEAKNGDLGGYEQSDLLWGKISRIMPTTEIITVQLQHCLSGVRVHLNKGDGISDTEWQKLERIVTVDNTIRRAEANMSTGGVTSSGSFDRNILMAPQSNDDYRAVVIPQSVGAGKSLISITFDGQTYSHKLSTVIQYERGKLHNFTITINKSAITGDYEVSFADDGITPWVNDESSHLFSSMTYVVVNCPKIGTLKQCMSNAGIDYKTVKNLKVTGEITTEDFTLMRDEMPELKHLNLKNVIVKHICYYDSWGDTGNHDGNLYRDDMIPNHAFTWNKSIRSIVLPSKLTHIGDYAFGDTQLMYSTLEIPDGVTSIGNGAFGFPLDDLGNAEYNGVELILPASLDSIGSGAFAGCGFSCNLKLTDNIRFIGAEAFDHTPNFYGTFHVPSKLTQVDNVFTDLGSEGSFDGELEIPQGIKSISGAFGVSMKKRVALNLPAGVKRIGRGWPTAGFTSIHFNDDLEEIGDACFAWYAMPPDGITLPSSLKRIGYRGFIENGLEGELIIPEGCLDIGGGAFKDNQLTKVQLPSRLEVINGETFRNSGRLMSITIPKYVNYIGEDAFRNCGALQTVICLNPEPPTLGPNAFADNYFDKVILEVPEQSVELYRRTDGWKDFQNITAYHELAFNIPEIVCLDKGTTRQGMLRAEGEWEVCECPSWVTVSPMSGDYKDELTVTVASTTTSREGRIVFRLKDKNYTTYTDVRQVFSADYREDATVTLQTASGGGSAIPLFIVGEGYGAEDIASGKYLEDMREQMEHLFSTEPYKSYRQYFTVSTAFACSPQQGLGGLTKFSGNNDHVWQYAQQHGIDINGSAAILVLCNTAAYRSHTDLWDNGLSFSWLGKTTDAYPYDQRGEVLHHLGGRGFGKLGPEYVNHFTFMKACTCPGCNMTWDYQWARSKGWWQNVSITPKMTQLPWQPFIFHERYAPYVDVYEGALNHARSTYRSENQSVMGAVHVYYYNTISRYEIVRRIMEAAGKSISLEQFIQNDKLELPEE